MERGGDRFQVAHFTDQDHVRVLTQTGAKRRGKRRRIDFHLALVHESPFVAMQKFDRIFDGDDVFGTLRIYAIDHRGQCGRLTRTGYARNQDEPARFVADFFDDLRQIQLVEHANLSGNHAQYQSNVAALLEDVYTEASEAGNAVSHIKFGGLFEFLFLPVRHHAEGHVQHVFGRDTRLFGKRNQFAIDTDVRKVSNF